MKFNTKLNLLILFVLSVLTTKITAQYSSKKVKTKFEVYTDSLKQVDYNYIFPILGQKVYEKGFDIPYPVGIMANSIWMRQDIVFSNFQLGFKNDNLDIPLTSVEFIKFGKNTNDSQNYTIRPDIWVLPFLNVYGLFGYGRSTTDVNVTVPINLNTVVEQDFATKGFGVMAAGGVGPVWFSVDLNWTWNKPKLLDKPVQVNVMGIRFGHTFVFKQNPKRNIAVWVGGMRAKMGTETSGEISLREALPSDVWDKKDQFVADYDEWRNSPAYDDLTIAQKAAVNKVLDPLVNVIDSANGDGVVRYAMDKQTKQLWNGLVGAQFQLNKRWQFRTEGGVLGNRKSFLISANYRFLL
ncbi:hypothetical protein SAMN06265371_101414 [Lutibacter agarilyticus]|uniref:MetA-pathway of phenol degradation n=1 Tax=Lutibacter agarilyticus TaxID=1109740 RepID=A0A238VIS1_9FLAO|nr:hypothetical protein [Lutibacter agarilyticus]SNR33593.1 hypothetical protein SAMN06265371_101414 [Lutibacter agarilyticus]